MTPEHRTTQADFARFLRKAGHQVFENHRLPNNTIVDILSIDTAKRLCAWEVKSRAQPQELNAAWLKYAPACDQVTLVYPAAVDLKPLLADRAFRVPRASDNVGILAFVDGHVWLLRPPKPRALPSDHNNTLRAAHGLPQWLPAQT